MEGTQEHLDLTSAAARLRVPYHVALRYVLVGELKGFRLGCHWRVDLRSIERFEANRIPDGEPA